MFSSASPLERFCLIYKTKQNKAITQHAKENVVKKNTQKYNICIIIVTTIVNQSKLGPDWSDSEARVSL